MSPAHTLSMENRAQLIKGCIEGMSVSMLRSSYGHSREGGSRMFVNLPRNVSEGNGVYTIREVSCRRCPFNYGWEDY
jgi:hypothetical protein